MAKLLYSMGEVTEMFDVNASLIRYWESKFDCIKPHKNKKGNRMFTPSDIENLKLIYHLVKEKGMTLEGANKTMKRRGGKVKRDVSLLERLHHIRAMLVDVREALGDGGDMRYEAPIEAVEELIVDVENQTKRNVAESVAERETTEGDVQKVVAEEPTTASVAAESEAEKPAPRRRGRPRKEEGEAKKVALAQTSETTPLVTRRRTKGKKTEEAKELFPFYEQSLFQ